MESKPLTFLLEANWDISLEMAPCNLCVGMETVDFGIKYTQLRFPYDLLPSRYGDGTDQSEISHQLIDGLQWTFRLTLMLLRGWRWKMSLWDSFWLRLIPNLSNALGFRKCEKLMPLIDVCPNFLSESIHFFMALQANILTNSLLIYRICSLVLFTTWWKFSSGWWNTIPQHLPQVFHTYLWIPDNVSNAFGISIPFAFDIYCVL